MGFARGNNCNPHGRPKSSIGFREDCRKWAVEKGVPFLKELVENKNIDMRVRMAATVYMINHGFGQPATAVEVSGNISLEQLIAGVHAGVQNPVENPVENPKNIK